MLEKINNILNHTVEEVLNGPLSVDLMEVYSKLFLYGGAPRFCAACQRDYYKEIAKSGLEKYYQMENVKKRTCVPSFTDLKFICHPKLGHFHVSALWITDEKAIFYLENKMLSESDFTVLPQGYKSKENIPADEVVFTEKEAEIKTTEKEIQATTQKSFKKPYKKRK